MPGPGSIVQSVLAPAGHEAWSIHGLWLLMLWVTTAVYVVTMTYVLVSFARAVRHRTAPPKLDTHELTLARAVSSAVGFTVVILIVLLVASISTGGHGGGGMGPSLRDADWIYGGRDDQIFSSIVEGRAHGMPSWQRNLTSDQAWKLTAYIKSLGTRNEPQPPGE